MKVQIEISDVALRKVSALLMLAAQENEIEQIETVIKRLKEITEPIPLDISIFEEQSEKLEVAMMTVLVHQLLKEE